MPPVAAVKPVSSSAPARWKASKALGGRCTALLSMARSEKWPVRSGGTVASTAAPIREKPLTTYATNGNVDELPGAACRAGLSENPLESACILMVQPNGRRLGHLL